MCSPVYCEIVAKRHAWEQEERKARNPLMVRPTA